MLANRKILFVEDDVQEIASISTLLETLKADFTHAGTLSEAVRELVLHSYDFVLTDLHIDTKLGVEKPDGLVVIKAAVEQQHNITIVATSGDPRTEVVDAALAAGAQHFLRKPLSKADELEIAFKLADQRRRLNKTTAKSIRPKRPSGHWEAFAQKYPYGIVQGEFETKIAQLAARKKASFVVTGETGTGKEEAAKLVHRMRTEMEGPVPFVAVNCATITGNLAESLLFGHKAGAFTGAEEAAMGFIAEAEGGILFLDEIQILTIPVQQKLLRVLNDGTYNRVGDTKTHRSRFQLIAATTKDLSKEVEEGRFLVDIQMRMVGLELSLPPLRERLDDIPALLALFLSKKGILLDPYRFETVTSKLQSFSWPGNIRQFFKCLEAWLLYCELDGVQISAENFPMFKDLQVPAAKRVHGSREGHLDYNVALSEDRDYEQSMASYEKAFLANAMERHASIAEVCKAINIPRSTLDAKRRRHGLV